jgi:diguanylate cyclase (GGDEF)-like protein
MNFEFTPLILPLLASAGLNLALTRHVWSRRRFPGAVMLGACMALLAQWSIAYALVVAGADVETKMLWYRLEYIGVVGSCLAWAFFTMQYAGGGEGPRLWHFVLLAAEPAMTLGIVWTNELHRLMWPTWGTHQDVSFKALDVTFGQWYWVNAGYMYVLVLGGSCVLAWALARRRRLYVLQAVSLVVGVLAPLVGNLAYNAGLVGSLDLAPFGFSVSGIAWWLGFASGFPSEVVADPAREARAEITLGSGSTQRDFDLRLSPLWHRTGALAGRIVALRDVTDRNRAVEALAHQARHDSLTGLPNRTLLLDCLARACEVSAYEARAVGLLFVDLDNFKTVNDSLGHATGDELLVLVADRLRSCLRPGDIVARLGGDEFAVVLAGGSDAAVARHIAGRIIETLRQPFALGAAEVVIGASVGIALTSTSATDPGDLLRNADVALYAAKSQGKGRSEFFVEDMHRAAQSRLALQGEIRRALANEEFTVYYQPVVNLRSGAIVGCEALVRWIHPQRGMIPPLEFIPLCEELGLIVPLGEWVLREVCIAQRDWKERFPHRAAPVVTVNVSPRQLQQPGFVDRLASLLEQTGADSRSIVLEITEGVLLDDTDATLQVLESLRDLGFALAIDDFGTGYSALSYLQRFPINLLKIDRSFVNGLGRGGERSALVRAIVALGQALNLKLVAEGIEFPGQQKQLLALGCENGQGYLFARPEPRHVFEHLLEQERLGALPWMSDDHPALVERRAA